MLYIYKFDNAIITVGVYGEHLALVRFSPCNLFCETSRRSDMACGARRLNHICVKASWIPCVCALGVVGEEWMGVMGVVAPDRSLRMISVLRDTCI